MKRIIRKLRAFKKKLSYFFRAPKYARRHLLRLSLKRALDEGVSAFVIRQSLALVKLTLFGFSVALLTLILAIGGEYGRCEGYPGYSVSELGNVMLTYLTETFGALCMLVAGVLAIIASAFRQYKVGFGCLIVAFGLFILRSATATFCNDIHIQE